MIDANRLTNNIIGVPLMDSRSKRIKQEINSVNVKNEKVSPVAIPQILISKRTPINKNNQAAYLIIFWFFISDTISLSTRPSYLGRLI